MSLKAQVEALIYAAEEPITLEQLAALLKDAVLAELGARISHTAHARGNDSRCESTLLPELDAEEFDGLEPGPLMRERRHQFEEEIESISEPFEPDTHSISCADLFREGDEPLFARASEAATEATMQPEVAGARAEAAPAESAQVASAPSAARKRQPKKSEAEIAQDKAVRARLREVLMDLAAEYCSEERGMEIRQVAGGYRMATKPQHHDLVRAFAKSLKPPTRLSLAALETLAVIAYKQPITAPEIAEIRGVESGSVLGTLLDRKLITTAGRKQVIGRPMQYKTSREFLLRFGLNDVNELPSMEEFSQLALDSAIELGGAEPSSPTRSPDEQQFDEALPQQRASGASGEAAQSSAGEQNLQTQLETPPVADDAFNK